MSDKINIVNRQPDQYADHHDFATPDETMSRSAELQVSLTLVMSFFIHLIMMAVFIIPQLYDAMGSQKALKSIFREEGISRDIIVNINQDDRRVVVPETLLSDRDSTAKGYITKKTGNRWLNNSLDFKMLKGSRGTQKGERRSTAAHAGREKVLMSDDSEMIAVIERNDSMGAASAGSYSIFDETLIPDKNDVSRTNALFYSNDGRFSFNTVKFKDFKYFKNLKDKIASNWYPPLMANSIVQGYNPFTGEYAPGYTRIMAIPSQEVKMVFVLDKKGDVIHIQILDSMGNKPLNASCYDAIRLSKNFGPVPKDLLKSDVLVIPFIFGYYIY